MTGLSSYEFERLFSKAPKVGKSFPVYLVEGSEFALARKEVSTGPGHKDYIIDTKDVSIYEELYRRDLTINAMAIDILTGKLIDPYDGLKDIKDKVLRAVSHNFIDDPLRVYRVARFASQLPGFTADELTRFMMHTMRDKLESLPGERVFEELKKALTSDYPVYFFKELIPFTLLVHHFDVIRRLRYIPQVEDKHPEGDVFNHTFLALRAISQITNKPHLRFAVLMHDIGKGLTPPKEWPHHYEHSKLGLDALDEFTKTIPVPTKWYESAHLVIKEHNRLWDWIEMKPGKVVRLFKKIKRSPLTIEDMADAITADKLGRGSIVIPDLSRLDSMIELYHRMFEETSGDDIDSERYQGKAFGEQLFQLRCHWLNKERAKLLDKK